MAVYSFKPRFRQQLRILETRLIRAGISADQLTAVGLVFAVAGAIDIVLSSRDPLWLGLLPALLLLRLACNALDGMIAGDTRTVGPLGFVHNEVADRAADAVLLLAVAARVDAPLLGAATLALALLASHVAVAAAAAGGTRTHIGVMAKADRMLLLAVAAVLAVLIPTVPWLTGYLGAVAAGSVLTLAARWRATRRELALPGARR